MSLTTRKPKDNLHTQEALKEIRAEEMDELHIRIPRSLKDEIKMEALLRRTTVTNIIIDYFKEIVSNKR